MVDILLTASNRLQLIFPTGMRYYLLIWCASNYSRSRSHIILTNYVEITGTSRSLTTWNGKRINYWLNTRRQSILLTNNAAGRGRQGEIGGFVYLWHVHQFYASSCKHDNRGNEPCCTRWTDCAISIRADDGSLMLLSLQTEFPKLRRNVKIKYQDRSSIRGYSSEMNTN